MIDLKEAAQVALSYFEEIYGEDAFSNVLLEEVERDEEDDTPYWFITIGFTDKQGEGGPFGNLASSRRYKRFKIDAETGEVVSMKIRSLANA